MGCLVSFFMFKICGWCIQRHLYVKGRCWLCQIEVLLLDLLFMCDWESLWWGCSSWWPPFQSPDDPYCYTAVFSQRQWAGRQILYVMFGSSDLWLRFFIFAYSAYCWRLFYMLVRTQFSEWSYLHLDCSCSLPFVLSYFFRVSSKAAQMSGERFWVWSLQAYIWLFDCMNSLGPLCQILLNYLLHTVALLASLSLKSDTKWIQRSLGVSFWISRVLCCCCFDVRMLEEHLNAMHVAMYVVVNKLMGYAEVLHFQCHYSDAQHIFRDSAVSLLSAGLV